MLHVVTGPPCAGKTTYVNEHKHDGDVVIDLDSIAQALGSSDRYDYSGEIKKAAFAARRAAIDAIGDGDAWVIHTRPTDEQRAEYSGATFHDLDPGMDVCLARAKSDNRPRRTEAAIRDWYAKTAPQGAFSLTHLRPAGMVAPIPARAGEGGHMADEITQEVTEGTTEQTASAEQSGQRTFTQEDVDRLVGAARVKERKKYEGYVDGTQLTEATERATKAEAELAELKATAQRNADVSAAAEKAGIPLEVAQMLNGSDADELLEQAKKLLKLMPVHPTRTDDGGSRAAAKRDTAQQFGDLIESILK